MSEPLFAFLPDLTQALHSNMAGAEQESELESELESAVNELQFGDFHQRWDAAKRLPGLGDRAIAPLLNLLSDAADDWELLWFVARALGHFQHPSAIAALAQLLESSADPEIVAMAATALVNFGEAAIPALTDLLKQQSTRLIALQALAQIPHPAVLSLLLEAATDRSAAVRAAAISALAQVTSQVASQATPQTTAACWAAFGAGLNDSAAVVRRAAVMAIGSRAEQFIAALGGEAVGAKVLVDAIRPLLADPNLEIGRQAALALGRIGSESAIAILGAALLESSSSLQVELLRALVWTEHPLALAQIQQYLKLYHDSSTGLEQEIVGALGRVTVSAPIAAQILLELLNSAHPIAQTVMGKQQIALSLGQLQQAESIDSLIELLADSMATVRLHAAAALKRLAAQGAALRMRQYLLHPNSSAALKAEIAVVLQDLLR